MEETPVEDETVKWHCHTVVEKYNNLPDVDQKIIDAMIGVGEIQPDEVVESEGNLLVIGGASVMWERLIGTALTAFDNTNAFIGVGDSSTAAADTQTDLVAVTNKVRVGMVATYPQHTDTTGTAGSKSIVYQASFGSAVGNFAWLEWGIFNAAAAGRMLNRKQESLGTKTAGSTWVMTVTLSLA